MQNNELTRLSRITLLLSIIFLIFSGYYFMQPNPTNTCRSGCENDFNFIINPLKGFRSSEPSSKKLPKPALEDISNNIEMCPQVCFIPKHPLSYLFFDISIILSVIRGILILKNAQANKNAQK